MVMTLYSNLIFLISWDQTLPLPVGIQQFGVAAKSVVMQSTLL